MTGNLPNESVFHEQSELAPVPMKNELRGDLLSLYHVFGMNALKRDNILMLNANEVLYIAGNSIILFNLVSKIRRYIFSISRMGVGCMAVNRKKSLLFVGELGVNPLILVYTLPSFSIINKLKGGAENGYSCMDLSSDETKLCSVSTGPDYGLTVWDWSAEKIILRTKAFGQDIFKVSFSPYNQGCITTSGNGHIRFWKMATTFTGLKLQGELGKFGKVDLSDVEAFAELPNGTFVSGSESGHLLLWEDSFLKCRFITEIPGNTTEDESVHKESNHVFCNALPAHCGGVFTLMFDKKANQLVSAGADGFIRWWDYDTIGTAEVDMDTSMDFPIRIAREMSIGRNVIIRNLSFLGESDPHFLVQDQRGSLMKVSLDGDESLRLSNFHSGAISGLVVSPIDHIAVTVGIDGSVRSWNYLEKKLMSTINYDIGCSAVEWLSSLTDKTNRYIMVGFNDGNVRCLYLKRDKFVLRQILRPHAKIIRCIQNSKDGHCVASSSDDGTIFIFQRENKNESKRLLIPIGFIDCKKAVINFSWKHDNSRILYNTEKGNLFEVNMGSAIRWNRSDSKKDSFLLNTTETKELKLPKSWQNENCINVGDDSHTEPVRCAYATYNLNNGSSSMLYSSTNPTNQWITEVSINTDKKPNPSPSHVCKLYGGGEHGVTTYIGFNKSTRFVITCASDGSATVRAAANPSYFIRHAMHGRDVPVSGAVMSWDDRFLLTAGADGVLIVHRIDCEKITQSVNSSLQYEEGHTDKGCSLLSRGFEDSGEGNTKQPKGFCEIIQQDQPILENVENIQENQRGRSTVYTIEEETQRKKMDQEDLAIKKKKNAIRRMVAELRAEYRDIIGRNSALPKEAQLLMAELVADSNFEEILSEEKQNEINKIVQECAYESEKTALRRSKLQEAYIDELGFDLFFVHGLRNGQMVQSFPTRKVSSILLQLQSDPNNKLFDKKDSGSAEGTVNKENNRSGGDGHVDCCNKVRYVLRQNQNSMADVSEDEPRLSTFVMRKSMRAERKKIIEDKVAQKPSDEVNKEDMRAILEARASLGDYKIKSAKDYKVPDEKQVNTQKKLREIMILQESLHNMKCIFNKRLVALSDTKQHLLRKKVSWANRLREINRELGEDVLSEHLETKTEFLDELKRPCQDSFIKYGSDTLERVVPESCLVACENEESIECVRVSFGLNNILLPHASCSTKTLFVKSNDDTASDSESDGIKEKIMLLNHERASIKRKLNAEISNFDKCLYDLQKERFQLATELISGEIHLKVLHQELVMLFAFESKEELLSIKLAKCEDRKEEILACISENKSLLESKRDELEYWIEQDKSVLDSFGKLVPETHICFEHLKKIFMRKIKRKTNFDSSDESDFSDEESDYEDDWDEDISGEARPSDCEIETYEGVIQLREKRLEQEEKLANFNRELDVLKRAHDRQVLRDQQSDTELQNVRKEIQNFQREKQHSFNEVFVTILLTAKQMYLWDFFWMRVIKQMMSIPTQLRHFQHLKIVLCSLIKH